MLVRILGPSLIPCGLRMGPLEPRGQRTSFIGFALKTVRSSAQSEKPWRGFRRRVRKSWRANLPISRFITIASITRTIGQPGFGSGPDLSKVPAKPCSSHAKVAVGGWMDGWKRGLKRSQPSVGGIVPGIGKHFGKRTHGLGSCSLLGALQPHHNFKVHPGCTDRRRRKTKLHGGLQEPVFVLLGTLSEDATSADRASWPHRR